MMSPIGWTKRTLIDLCEEHVDCVNRTAPAVPHETPFKMIRTTNVRNGFIDVNKVRHVEKPVFDKWTRRLVPKPGDVILTREAPLGEVGMLRSSRHIFLGQRLYHFRANSSVLDPHFLLYALLEDDLQGQIKGFGSGSTVEHMRLSDIPRLEITVPCIATQRKIAGVLSAYDDLIENNTRRIAILEEMAQAIYREWFVNFRFPGHENVKLVDSPLGQIPEGWEVGQLGSLCKLKYGKMPRKEDRVESGYPIFSGYGIVGFHNEYLYEDKEVVVIARGVGRCGQIVMSPPKAFITNISIVIQPTTANLVKLFLYYRLLDTQLTSLNKGTAQTQVTISDIELYQIALPPLELQEHFVGITNDIDAEIETLGKKTSNLGNTRDLLLPKLISGKLDVENLDIDVGEPIETLEEATA
jgi:type I restriction enzyme S subunit